jgi:hypothetical protein
VDELISRKIYSSRCKPPTAWMGGGFEADRPSNPWDDRYAAQDSSTRRRLTPLTPETLAQLAAPATEGAELGQLATSAAGAAASSRRSLQAVDIAAAADGYSLMKHQPTGQYVTWPLSGSPNTGTRSGCCGSRTQQWKCEEFIYSGNSKTYYSIRQRETGQCLARNSANNAVTVLPCSQSDINRFWWIRKDITGLPANHFVFTPGSSADYLYRDTSGDLIL